MQIPDADTDGLINGWHKSEHKSAEHKAEYALQIVWGFGECGLDLKTAELMPLSPGAMGTDILQVALQAVADIAATCARSPGKEVQACWLALILLQV